MPNNNLKNNSLKNLLLSYKWIKKHWIYIAAPFENGSFVLLRGIYY